MKNLILLVLCSLLLNCTTRTSAKETNYCKNIQETSVANLSKEISSVSKEMERQTGVRILEKGTNALLTRAWLCQQAEKSIDIQYFIFAADNVGLIACDYLVKAADRGVQVNILVDDIVVDAELSDLISLDKHPNISIKIYNPGVNLGKNLFQKLYKFATDYVGANQRMHNKTFIVDDKIAITGGRNMADEYFDYDQEYNFRDRDILLLGKGVDQLCESYEKFWNYKLSIPVKHLMDKEITTPINYNMLHEYACNPENYWPTVRKLFNTYSLIQKENPIVWLDSIEFISDIPGKNNGTKGLYGGGNTSDRLLQLLRAAKKTIYIQTPYLITTNQTRTLFKELVNQGIEINILTNGLASTDALEAFSAYQTDRTKTLATGVSIYEYKPNSAIQKELMTGALHKNKMHQPIFGLHAKSMVIDNNISVIGTFNLDPRSTHLNTECITILNSTSLAKEILSTMKTDLLPENSWKITTKFNPDYLVNKAKQIKAWSRKIVPKNIL